MSRDDPPHDDDQERPEENDRNLPQEKTASEPEEVRPFSIPIPSPEVIPPQHPLSIQVYVVSQHQLDALQSLFDDQHAEDLDKGRHSNIVWGAGGILVSSLAAFVTLIDSYKGNTLVPDFFLLLSIVMITVITLKGCELWRMGRKISKIKERVSKGFEEIRKQSHPM